MKYFWMFMTAIVICAAISTWLTILVGGCMPIPCW